MCAVAPHTVTDSVPIKYSAYSAKEIMTFTTNTFESGQRPSPWKCSDKSPLMPSCKLG